ncbi:MAG: metal-dependent transcriptional regulator [Planctomycetota bacterium]|jgi:DtxR family Mn-dependent transcriptional regulator|nr:metal-dependent transcriptional regulator [Planctomycetota bacterium]
MQKNEQLTSALEDYLEAIYNLSRFDHSAHAHSRDIAEALSVHKSTVTAALRTLGQMGLINYTPYEAVTLTPNGRKKAENVVWRHQALRDFFVDVLKVDADMAEKAACGMEHSMPAEIVEKLAKFGAFFEKCPLNSDEWMRDGIERCPGPDGDSGDRNVRESNRDDLKRGVHGGNDP